MHKRTTNLLILLIGLFLGACIGALYTPEKGSVIRSGLLYHVKSYQRKLRSLIKKLIRKNAHVTNQAKNMGDEVIIHVISSAERILQELDLLTEQLTQKND